MCSDVSAEHLYNFDANGKWYRVKIAFNFFGRDRAEISGKFELEQDVGVDLQAIWS